MREVYSYSQSVASLYKYRLVLRVVIDDSGFPVLIISSARTSWIR